MRCWRLIVLALLLGAFAVPAAATDPVQLNLPVCDNSFRDNPGDHADNCTDNGGLGGCNGIIGDEIPGPIFIPAGQQSCPGHNILGCDRVSTVPNSNNTEFEQRYCSTVPIWLVINGNPTLVAPGVGIPTDWRVVNSCAEAQPDEECAQYGCHWNIPYYDGNPTPDPNICKPAVAKHFEPCDCRPLLCGDGIKQPWEDCDDGNLVNGDGCSATCSDHEVCSDLVDNDGDTDVDCVDPDCDCDPLNVTFSCPSRVRLYANRPDQFAGHGSMAGPCPTVDLQTEAVCVALLNTSGVVMQACLAPGDLQQKPGGKLVYKNPLAKFFGDGDLGLAQFITASSGVCKFRFQAFDVLPVLTDPDMTIQIAVGSDVWSYSATWIQKPNGWRTP